MSHGAEAYSEHRTYTRHQSIVFWKTSEPFGGLSNMASGYPLIVCGIRIKTSEALYQACRFPDFPDIQRKIIDQASPMSAKMVGKPFRHQTRPDWDLARVAIMRWCLRVKLALNWDSFGALLRSTDNYPIVEQSRRDPFWGAQAIEPDMLTGQNVLGRLLMELRSEMLTPGLERDLRSVRPPCIENFRLLEQDIDQIRKPYQKDMTDTERSNDKQSENNNPILQMSMPGIL